MTHLAREFNLSDVGLRQICKSHHIPTPGIGYWNKKAAGKSVSQLALPANTDPSLQVITLRVDDVPTPAPNDIPEEITREKQPEWKITVPEDLPLRHPLVKSAQTALTRQVTYTYDNIPGPYRANRFNLLLRHTGKRQLPVSVDVHSIPRALRIMQALLDACERRGFAISVTDDKPSIAILGERIQFVLYERFTTRTAANPKGWGRVETVPSGKLRLEWEYNKIEDSPRHRVEDRLNQFLMAAVAAALDRKARHAAHIEGEAHQRHAEQARRQRIQALEIGRLRKEHLDESSRLWKDHCQLAHFLDIASKRLTELPETKRAGGEQWIRWARAYLAEHDPVMLFLVARWSITPAASEETA